MISQENGEEKGTYTDESPVMEMVDIGDLKSPDLFGRTGSTPVLGISTSKSVSKGFC